MVSFLQTIQVIANSDYDDFFPEIIPKNEDFIRLFYTETKN